MQLKRRTVGIAVVAAGAGALLAPAGYSVAKTAVQQVLITNGDDRPVPTKAIGTTAVSGSVGVPDGVAVTNKPSVAVPDGVSINGPVAVQTAGPERYQEELGTDGNCKPLVLPEGKRLVVEAAHGVALNGDVADAYIRVVHKSANGFTSRHYRLEHVAGDTARFEGPVIDDADDDVLVCADTGSGTFIAWTVVGLLENE